MLGNVVLKNSEAVAKIVMNMSDDKELEHKVRSMYDYSNLGSSFLLGTNKIICKTHGNISSQTVLSVAHKLINLYENDYISKIVNI
jgi:fatty acid/phospholipid biosynthesis enzyme